MAMRGNRLWIERLLINKLRDEIADTFDSFSEAMVIMAILANFYDAKIIKLKLSKTPS